MLLIDLSVGEWKFVRGVDASDMRRQLEIYSVCITVACRTFILGCGQVRSAVLNAGFS